MMRAAMEAEVDVEQTQSRSLDVNGRTVLARRTNETEWRASSGFAGSDRINAALVEVRG